jgi:hypothetical protein
MITSSPFSVRKASAADAMILTANNVTMALETEGISLNLHRASLGVLGVLADPFKATYFVAEADKAVVASLMITREWSDWRNG